VSASEWGTRSFDVEDRAAIAVQPGHALAARQREALATGTGSARGRTRCASKSVPAVSSSSAPFQRSGSMYAM
jgi:hypothetical protein